jgi:hypothetical protein
MRDINRQAPLASLGVASRSVVTIGATRGPGYDQDTLDFAAASGATSLGPINAFVLRLKAEGLWGLIRAWPMLLGQNAGSGATVYGLGGLSGENGTLVNSPARQVGGIQFIQASGQQMTVAITGYSGRYAVGGVFTPLTSGAANSCFIAVNGPSAADSTQINDGIGSGLGGGHRQVAGSTYISPSPQAFANGASFFVVQGWDLSTVRRMKDGSLSSAASPAFGGAISPLRINARGDTGGVGANKRCAFAFRMANNASSAAEYEALRFLYKETLGSGLGLI